MISARQTNQSKPVFTRTVAALKYIPCLLVLFLMISCGKEPIVEPEPVDPLLLVKMDDFVGKWKVKDSEEYVEIMKREDGKYIGIYVYYSDWYKGYDKVLGSAYFHPVNSIETQSRDGLNQTPQVSTRFTYFYKYFEFVIEPSGTRFIRSPGLNPVSYYKEE